ncbi:hypothetical protein EV182_006465, partial [Spiromyces aspiralis]
MMQAPDKQSPDDNHADAATSTLSPATIPRLRRARRHPAGSDDGMIRGLDALELLNVYAVEDDGHDGNRRGRGSGSRKRRKYTRPGPLPLPSSPSPQSPSSSSSLSLTETTGRGKKAAHQAEKPRWYNQMYMMFLALRQSPNHTASRSELVRKAVELDKKISEERNLPR